MCGNARLSRRKSFAKGPPHYLPGRGSATTTIDIMKQLSTPRLDQCIGCHSCALACARLVHKKGSWHCAGIRIRSAGGLSTGFTASRCLSCDPPPCAAVCPTGALTPRRGGGVVVRKGSCIRCGACVAACPVDGIATDHFGDIYICIHCGLCVPFCPQNCLEMVDGDAAGEVR
jgi:Fe-S-cluster-containing hydrogenase component 2